MTILCCSFPNAFCAEHLAPASKVDDPQEEIFYIMMARSEEDDKIFLSLRKFQIQHPYPYPLYVLLGKYFVRITAAMSRSTPWDGLGEPVHSRERRGEKIDYYSTQSWPEFEPFLEALPAAKDFPDLPPLYQLNPDRQPTLLAKRLAEKEEDALLAEIHALPKNPASLFRLNEIVMKTNFVRARAAAFQRLSTQTYYMTERRSLIMKQYQNMGNVLGRFEPDGTTFLGVEALRKLEKIRGAYLPDELNRQGFREGTLNLILADLKAAQEWLKHPESTRRQIKGWNAVDWAGLFGHIPVSRREQMDPEEQIAVADPLIRYLSWRQDWERPLKDRTGVTDMEKLAPEIAALLADIAFAEWTGNAGIIKPEMIGSADPVISVAALRALAAIARGKMDEWMDAHDPKALVAIAEDFKAVFRQLQHMPKDRMPDVDWVLGPLTSGLMDGGDRSLDLIVFLRKDPAIRDNPALAGSFGSIFERTVENAKADKIKDLIPLLEDEEAAPLLVARVMELEGSRALKGYLRGIRSALIKEDFSSQARLKILAELRYGTKRSNYILIRNLLAPLLLSHPDKNFRMEVVRVLDELLLLREAHEALSQLKKHHYSELAFIVPGSTMFKYLTDMFLEGEKKSRTPEDMLETFRNWLADDKKGPFLEGEEVQEAAEILRKCYESMQSNLRMEETVRPQAPSAGSAERVVNIMKRLEESL